MLDESNECLLYDARLYAKIDTVCTKLADRTVGALGFVLTPAIKNVGLELVKNMGVFVSMLQKYRSYAGTAPAIGRHYEMTECTVANVISNGMLGIDPTCPSPEVEARMQDTLVEWVALLVMTVLEHTELNKYGYKFDARTFGLFKAAAVASGHYGGMIPALRAFRHDKVMSKLWKAGEVAVGPSVQSGRSQEMERGREKGKGQPQPSTSSSSAATADESDIAARVTALEKELAALKDTFKDHKTNYSAFKEKFYSRGGGGGSSHKGRGKDRDYDKDRDHDGRGSRKVTH